MDSRRGNRAGFSSRPASSHGSAALVAPASHLHSSHYAAPSSHTLPLALAYGPALPPSRATLASARGLNRSDAHPLTAPSTSVGRSGSAAFASSASARSTVPRGGTAPHRGNGEVGRVPSVRSGSTWAPDPGAGEGARSAELVDEIQRLWRQICVLRRQLDQAAAVEASMRANVQMHAAQSVANAGPIGGRIGNARDMRIRPGAPASAATTPTPTLAEVLALKDEITRRRTRRAGSGGPSATVTDGGDGDDDDGDIGDGDDEDDDGTDSGDPLTVARSLRRLHDELALKYSSAGLGITLGLTPAPASARRGVSELAILPPPTRRLRPANAAAELLQVRAVTRELERERAQLVVQLRRAQAGESGGLGGSGAGTDGSAAGLGVATAAASAAVASDIAALRVRLMRAREASATLAASHADAHAGGRMTELLLAVEADAAEARDERLRAEKRRVDAAGKRDMQAARVAALKRTLAAAEAEVLRRRGR